MMRIVKGWPDSRLEEDKIVMIEEPSCCKSFGRGCWIKNCPKENHFLQWNTRGMWMAYPRVRIRSGGLRTVEHFPWKYGWFSDGIVTLCLQERHWRWKIKSSSTRPRKHFWTMSKRVKEDWSIPAQVPFLFLCLHRICSPSTCISTVLIITINKVTLLTPINFISYMITSVERSMRIKITEVAMNR